MRIFLVTILLAWTTTIAFGKGCRGSYFISGFVYGSNNHFLKEINLTATVGKNVQNIKVDDKGYFEIEILWETTCPSNRGFFQRLKDIKGVNPKFIYIRFGEETIRIRNKWRKYSDCFPKAKEKRTWKRNLIFKKPAV